MKKLMLIAVAFLFLVTTANAGLCGKSGAGLFGKKAARRAALQASCGASGYSYQSESFQSFQTQAQEVAPVQVLTFSAAPRATGQTVYRYSNVRRGASRSRAACTTGNCPLLP